MTTIAPPETVRRRVRRLAATHVGPDALTKAVLTEIGHDPDALYAALREILPNYCRVILSAQRRQDNPVPSVELPEAREITIRGGNVSRKVQGITDAVTEWWIKEMQSQYHVQGRYVHLGDCTEADLLWSAQERRTHAARNVAEATRLEALALAMHNYGVQTVKELPHSEVADIMRRVA